MPDPIGFAPWPVLLDTPPLAERACLQCRAGQRSGMWKAQLPSQCLPQWVRSRSECGLLPSLWRCVSFFVPSPITSPSVAEAARDVEREGRLRRDEEVLDAPEELRQPVVQWEERKKSRAKRGSLCARRGSRKTVTLILFYMFFEFPYEQAINAAAGRRL